MNSSPRFMSHGVERVLHELQPWGSPEGTRFFPNALGQDPPRTESRKPWHRWLRECVDLLKSKANFACDRDALNAFAVRPDLAVFAKARWENKTELAAATVQALKCEGTLEDLLRGPVPNAYYFRLDFDREKLGALFSHPFPHVHVIPEGLPRLPAPVGPSGNVIVDFLEWVFLQCHHGEWLEWAKEMWKQECLQKGMPEEREWFPAFCWAFRKDPPGGLSTYQYLRKHAEKLNEMKHVWREAKERDLSLRMAPEARALLDYPA